mmetsp:Transcript_27113/g.64820  ORF Transcript_27113/g.64820 Transcript_27113/m.64820 type:complete len:242 (+) Transcript_27113:321-1046(+)
MINPVAPLTRVVVPSIVLSRTRDVTSRPVLAIFKVPFPTCFVIFVVSFAVPLIPFTPFFAAREGSRTIFPVSVPTDLANFPAFMAARFGSFTTLTVPFAPDFDTFAVFWAARCILPINPFFFFFPKFNELSESESPSSSSTSIIRLWGCSSSSSSPFEYLSFNATSKILSCRSFRSWMKSSSGGALITDAPLPLFIIVMDGLLPPPPPLRPGCACVTLIKAFRAPPSNPLLRVVIADLVEN